MSFDKDEIIACSTNLMFGDISILETSMLKSMYKPGMILDAFVTNVHNVPQLRFFMFVKNVQNAEHFANIHNAATPPNAYKCQRMPREGCVFALRLGESTMVRAVRLRTMCINNTREVFLPDIGRNEILNEDAAEMYHLPLRLRTLPGLAIPCQLRGINDDVTILPDNMRSFIKGLLFHSVKLRVDGYMGNMLKVQLIDITLNKLVKWALEIRDGEKDLSYALKNTILYEPAPKYKENIKPIVKPGIRRLKTENKLEPIAEQTSCEDETSFDSNNGAATISIVQSSMWPSATAQPSTSSHTYSWPIASDKTVTVSSPASINEDLLFSNTASKIQENQESQEGGAIMQQQHNVTELNGDGDGVDTIPIPIPEPKRPLLGRQNPQLRPILGGGNNVSLIDNSWKQDVMPALMAIDKRETKLNIARDDILTITPTCFSQLERFIGIIHSCNETHMQHVWTDDEIPWSSRRHTETWTPYIFDVVLAKHSDMKWYRAKVIEICKEKKKILVFYVDYGGTEYVDVWNLASLSRSIAKLPFEAVLFRLCDLIDVTTTKAERTLGIEFLRSMLHKKTITVRVVSCRGQEIGISFEDRQLQYLSAALIRKGFMKPYGAM